MPERSKLAIEKPAVNNTLVLLTSRCPKMFYSVLKHAYQAIEIQYLETRYNNKNYNTAVIQSECMILSLVITLTVHELSSWEVNIIT